MRKGTDQSHIHELIEEKVVEDQRDELIKGIAGCLGEYRLAEDFKEKTVSPSKWSQMTTEQRKAYTKKVLHMKPENLGLRVQSGGETNTCPFLLTNVTWKISKLQVRSGQVRLQVRSGQ